jgi:WD40 repeat protein
MFLVGGSTAQSQFAEVSVWKLEFNRGIRQLRGLTTFVRKVVYSPDGASIAALSDEWQVGVWDCGSERLRALIEVPPGILADNAALAFAPEGDRLAYAAGNLARVYDLNNRRMIEAWSLDRGRGEQLRFEPDGSLTLIRMERRSGVDRWAIYELEAATAPQLKRVQPRADYWTDSVYLPARGPRFFGVGRLEHTAQNIAVGFALDTGDEVWRQPLPHTNNWMRLIVDADGRWLATEDVTPDLTNPVFQAADGRIVQRPRAPWLAIGSRSGVHASPDADYKLLLIRKRDGTDAVPISIDGKWSKDTLAFSPDERHLAAGNNDGTVLVADIEAVRQRLRALSVNPAKLIRPDPAAFGAVGQAR